MARSPAPGFHAPSGKWCAELRAGLGSDSATAPVRPRPMRLSSGQRAARYTTDCQVRAGPETTSAAAQKKAAAADRAVQLSARALAGSVLCLAAPSPSRRLRQRLALQTAHAAANQS